MNRAQRTVHRWVFVVLAPLLVGIVIYAWNTRKDPHAPADRPSGEQSP